MADLRDRGVARGLEQGILVVAAHPDDETLGVGGTIARAVHAGMPAEVLVMTDPAVLRHSDSTTSARLLGDLALRRQEVEKAGACLGVRKIHYGGFLEVHLTMTPFPQLVRTIEHVVQELRPVEVYTHCPSDLHQDHRLVAEATFVACRPAHPWSPARVLSYQMDFQGVGGLFRGWSWFVDISDTLEQKLDALQCYQSELRAFPHPRALDTVRAQAQFLGGQVGMEAAEAFFLVRGCQ